MNSSYLKTGLALLCALIAVKMNLFMLAIVHDRVPANTTGPLPDLGFDLLPRIDSALIISECIIIVEFVMLFFVPILHKNWLIVRRFCIILCVIYIFRAVCMISTVFPIANDSQKCEPQTNRSEVAFTGELRGNHADDPDGSR